MGEKGKRKGRAEKGREGKGEEGKGTGQGRRGNGREERSSHTVATLGLAKPRAGPDCILLTFPSTFHFTLRMH